MLPTVYEKGKRYPLVVYVYGGQNLSEAVNQFGGAGDDLVKKRRT
jgi:dipeptidyl aminopeptidase/acylaminoacyl peptidase